MKGFWEVMKELRKPHIRRRRFYNCENEKCHGFFFRSAHMFIKSYFLRRTRPAPGDACWVESAQPKACCIEPVITWIGHASFLVQIGGLNILIDPIFGNLSLVYKRVLPPGITIEKLPPIDFVLISHNHIDHMDGKSLLAIKERYPNARILVPLGDKLWFDKRRFAHVDEHQWWEKQVYDLPHDETKNIAFTFLPTAHWSQRGLFDRNKSLWGSWMISCLGHNIYFGGDSYYSPHFSEIAKEFPKIDVALLPVGPGEPRNLLEDWHLDAKEAGQAFLDLGALHFIPMHWGTFTFGVEHFDAPVLCMQQWWKENKKDLDGCELHCPKAGKPVAFGCGADKLKK